MPEPRSSRSEHEKIDAAFDELEAIAASEDRDEQFYLRLMEEIGMEPERRGAPEASAVSDLEWEHFSLLVSASFEPTLSRDASPSTVARRDIPLYDEHSLDNKGGLLDALAVISGDEDAAPVLRLEVGETGIHARILELVSRATPTRIMVYVGDTEIQLTVQDGEFRGFTPVPTASPGLLDSTIRVEAHIG